MNIVINFIRTALDDLYFPVIRADLWFSSNAHVKM